MARSPVAGPGTRPLDDAAATRSRREIFAAAGSGLLAASLGRAPVLAAEPRLKDVGRKFELDGRVRPFAGNTIICHIPQQGAGYGAFDQLLDIYRELPGLQFFRKLNALPASSYHMTVFSGPTDQGRSAKAWPAGVPLDAPMETCNAILLRRLRTLRLGCEPPFRMVVDDRPLASKVSPITLPLRSATPADAEKLRLARARIADALGYRSPDHDTYQFHITIGYQIALFTPAEQSEYEAALDAWRSRLIRNAVHFDLGAPEYCTFRDMYAFQTQLLLRA